MNTINSGQWYARLKRCAQGKHKMRENQYGVIFCANCGLLGKSDSGAEKLNENDKLLIINDENS